MANTSISVPDETLEDFDKILTVMSARGEIESDRRSPIIADWMEDFNEEHQDYVDLYDEVFSQGNPTTSPATPTAD